MQETRLYKYKAIHDNGLLVRGVLSAYNELDLDQRLIAANSQLISCFEIRAGPLSRFGLFRAKFTLRDKIQFYKSMEQMQRAGIPVLDCLNNCLQSSSTTISRDIMSSLHNMVNNGAQMSEAMGKHENVFSGVERTVIASKEKTGDFENGFKYLCDFLTKQDALIRQLKKATRYPMVLILVIIVAIVVMLGFVTPQILDFVVVAQGAKEPPFATKSLMATSNFFQNYWWAVAAGIIGGATFVRVMRQISDGFAYKFDALVVNLPVFGELLVKLEISRFCTTFTSLYSSGLNFLSCIELSRAVVRNRVLKGALETVQKEVSDGRSFDKSLQGTGQFPNVVIQMIGIGEETGNITQIMEQIVEFYENDINDSIDAMVSMIEPVLTMVLACVIVWIAAAVFGPIYSMFETLQI